MFCYLITNKINGNRYIGITKMPSKGWIGHRKNARNKYRSRLCAAIRKYGAENFYLELIGSADGWENLCKLETEMIAKLKPEYNMTSGGEGIPNAAPETRARMSSTRKKMFQQPHYVEARIVREQERKRRSAETPARLRRQSLELAEKRKAETKAWREANPYIRSEQTRKLMSELAKARAKTPEGQSSIRKAIAARIKSRAKKSANHDCSNQ